MTHETFNTRGTTEQSHIRQRRKTMKLLIDIADFVYDSVAFGETAYKEHICNAIRNGTPIPDNATNGDVLKTLFPPLKVEMSVFKNINATHHRSIDDHHGFQMVCGTDWWNAPYKADKEESNADN